MQPASQLNESKDDAVNAGQQSKTSSVCLSSWPGAGCCKTTFVLEKAQFYSHSIPIHNKNDSRQPLSRLWCLALALRCLPAEVGTIAAGCQNVMAQIRNTNMTEDQN